MKVFMKILAVSVVFFCFVNISAAADPGITKDEILIGSSLVLKGPAEYLGIQTNHGFLTYIKAINEQGGISGRKIRLIAYDDGYEPVPCIENTKKLIEQDNVFILTSYVGTPTTVKAQPVWTEAKVPVVGFFTGAEALRIPFNRYNVHIRASYYQEAKAIVDAFINKLGFKNIAVFYQNDAFGETVKKGTEIALEKYGLKPVAYGTYERNTLDVKAGLDKLLPSKPQGIVMVGTYSPLAKFVKEAKKAGLNKTLFHTVSFVGPEAFAKALGTDSSNCIVSQVIPPYDTAKLPLIQEYVGLLRKYYPEDRANFVSLEGYINAKVLVSLLKNTKELTREGFLKAVDSTKDLNIGGLVVSYGPEDHEGLKQVYLTEIRDGLFHEVKDWPKFK